MAQTARHDGSPASRRGGVRPSGPTYNQVGVDFFSTVVIFFLPDPRSALRAWRAALRPGGRLGLTTFTDRDDERWRWLEQVFPDRDPRSTRPGEEEDDSPFSSDERLHALLESAGF